MFGDNSIDQKCQFVENMDLKMCNGHEINDCEIDKLKDILEYFENHCTMEYEEKRIKKILKKV